MPTFTYQWERDDGDISGANGSVFVASPGQVSEQYTPITGDIGHTIRLRATDGINTFYSGWSDVVAATPSSGTGYDAGPYEL